MYGNRAHATCPRARRTLLLEVAAAAFVRTSRFSHRCEFAAVCSIEEQVRVWPKP